ncbi:TetR/AcrR family transcriptional regulator [Streptomyces sp. NPDC094468]|uniref:TetR/AcrR family transcriptional regulator n=1 Tax=Streptomyces sp. NPDC094468 TaxID=3366066 RepID=UPI0038150C90
MAQRLTRRGPLSRQEIVLLALEVAEAEGVEKLSLHKVAAAAGVRTMSLYNHIRDKDDVLDAMADTILRRVGIGDTDAPEWSDALRELAFAFRAAALEFPRSAPLVLTRRMNAPAGLPLVEAALRVLRRAGLEPPAAVHVLRSFIAFLIGTLSREVGTAPSYAAVIPEVVTSRAADLATSGYPAVAAAAAELSVCDHEAELRFGLDLLIEAVRRRTEPAA